MSTDQCSNGSSEPEETFESQCQKLLSGLQVAQGTLAKMQMLEAQISEPVRLNLASLTVYEDELKALKEDYARKLAHVGQTITHKEDPDSGSKAE